MRSWRQASLPAPRASLPRRRRIDARARRLVEAIRARASGLGGIDEFLHAYSLSTKEGLALMVLAEALLRVPDAATADRLIEDKLAAGRWLDGDVKSTALLVSASVWTLGVAARIIHPGETPEIHSRGHRAPPWPAGHARGDAAGDAASRRAFRHRAKYRRGAPSRPARMRTSAIRSTCSARARAPAPTPINIFAPMPKRLKRSAATQAMPALPGRPGISVKLSALHPRYEAISRDRVRAELRPRLLELAQLAKTHDLQFTIDAEEADRLELSLDIIGAVLDDASLGGWDGFGLAVQAYQKRAVAVIDWAADMAAAKNRRLTVRLVKGAYWDTEIKRAQERGLADYPVFTRKPMTDLCYTACVKKLLAARPRLFPQFATHNALTVASVIEDAGGIDGYEFQRLYGMGESLYDALLAEFPDAACRIYAPVGSNRDLLAYLVRRLLENGANSSFVSVAADPNVPIAEILRRPQSFDRRRAAGAQSQNSAAARSLSAGAARLGWHRIRRSRQPRRAVARGARRRERFADRRRQGCTARSTASRCPEPSAPSIRRSTADKSAA